MSNGDDTNNPYLIIKKTIGARYFVSERHYLNRNKKFLSNLTKATYIKRNVKRVLGLTTDQIYIYEVKNHNTTAVVFPKIEDFISPETRKQEWGGFQFDQEHYTFKYCRLYDSIKKKLFQKMEIE